MFWANLVHGVTGVGPGLTHIPGAAPEVGRSQHHLHVAKRSVIRQSSKSRLLIGHWTGGPHLPKMRVAHGNLMKNVGRKPYVWTFPHWSVFWDMHQMKEWYTGCLKKNGEGFPYIHHFFETPSLYMKKKNCNTKWSRRISVLVGVWIHPLNILLLKKIRMNSIIEHTLLKLPWQENRFKNSLCTYSF